MRLFGAAGRSGGTGEKGGAAEAAHASAPDVEAALSLSPISLLRRQGNLSPISLRSGGEKLDTIDTSIAVFGSSPPPPPPPAEPGGDNHEEGERQPSRPASVSSHALPLPVDRPGTGGGSERGGEDRKSRPSSGTCPVDSPPRNFLLVRPLHWSRCDWRPPSCDF